MSLVCDVHIILYHQKHSYNTGLNSQTRLISVLLEITVLLRNKSDSKYVSIHIPCIPIICIPSSSQTVGCKFKVYAVNHVHVCVVWISRHCNSAQYVYCSWFVGSCSFPPSVAGYLCAIMLSVKLIVYLMLCLIAHICWLCMRISGCS